VDLLENKPVPGLNNARHRGTRDGIGLGKNEAEGGGFRDGSE